MEPMLVEEAVGELDDLAFDLIAEASQLGGRIHPILQESVGTGTILMMIVLMSLTIKARTGSGTSKNGKVA